MTFSHLAAVVPGLDSAILQINHYPLDSDLVAIHHLSNWAYCINV